MKDSIPFVYNILLSDENMELCKGRLKQIVDANQNNKNCLVCNLFQDKNNHNLFIIYELWINMEAWRMHMLSESAQEFTQFAEENNIKLHIYSLNKVL